MFQAAKSAQELPSQSVHVAMPPPCMDRGSNIALEKTTITVPRFVGLFFSSSQFPDPLTFGLLEP